MAQKHIWLIRHGETDFNIQRRWQGHLPTPLNSNGQQQAQALATHLQNQSFDAIYTSDLPRSYQTATPLANLLGLTPKRDYRLREIKLGIFTGLVSAQIRERYPDVHTHWCSNDESYIVPKGESRDQVAQRMQEILREVADSPQQHVALFTHGGTVRILLRRLFPGKYPPGGAMAVPNTSYTVLVGSNNAGWRVSHLTQTPHLSETRDTTPAV